MTAYEVYSGAGVLLATFPTPTPALNLRYERRYRRGDKSAHIVKRDLPTREGRRWI